MKKDDTLQKQRLGVLPSRRCYNIEGHVEGLRFALSPNFVVRLAADKNFYLRLMVKKMRAFVVSMVFKDTYLRSYDQLYGYG